MGKLTINGHVSTAMGKLMFRPVTGLELLPGTLLLFQLLKVKLEHGRGECAMIAMVKRNAWVKDGKPQNPYGSKFQPHILHSNCNKWW